MGEEEEGENSGEKAVPKSTGSDPKRPVKGQKHNINSVSTKHPPWLGVVHLNKLEHHQKEFV